MRAVVQRVARARVDVDGETVGAIERGLLVLLGVGEDDTDADGAWMAAKIAGLRVFEDDAERMNLSVGEAGGAVLLVSQFTLYGDCRKGRRPSFIKAKHPDVAAPMVDAVADALRADGLHVEMGRFGAHMDVDLLNDGPVTLLLDSTKLF